MQSQKTNILYLTTRCNLECIYCYESKKRNSPEFEHFAVTEEQIDEFVARLEEDEGEVKSSTIVIMGGEPTLAMDELRYLIDAIIASSRKMDKQYFASFTTNGVLLNNSKFYDELLALFEYSGLNDFHITLEISYDGIGQEMRPFPNGESSRDVVESVLHKLNDQNYPFKLSYTVSEKNYDKLYDEAIYFFENYPSLNKISFSFAFERLDQHLGQNFGFKLKDAYRPIMRKLYLYYRKPICGIACASGKEAGCEECNKGNFDGNRYLSPTMGILEKDKFTEDNFGQF